MVSATDNPWKQCLSEHSNLCSSVDVMSSLWIVTKHLRITMSTKSLQTPDCASTLLLGISNACSCDQGPQPLERMSFTGETKYRTYSDWEYEAVQRICRLCSSAPHQCAST